MYYKRQNFTFQTSVNYLPISLHSSVSHTSRSVFFAPMADLIPNKRRKLRGYSNRESGIKLALTIVYTDALKLIERMIYRSKSFLTRYNSTTYNINRRNILKMRSKSHSRVRFSTWHPVFFFLRCT